MKTIEGTIYSTLAECYKEPTLKFAGDVAMGRLYELMAAGLKKLYTPILPATLSALDRSQAIRTGDDGVERVFSKLKEDYYSLFFPLYVVPVESVYKEWRKDGGEGKGYIMGDPAIEMKKRYEMSGIEIPEEYKDTPDHISLLLEYASLLCENLSPELRSGFVLNHLDWIEELRGDIYKHSQSDFYRSVADVTVAFVKHERSNLTVLRR